MIAPPPPGTPADAVGLLTRVLPLVSGPDPEALAEALAAAARNLLRLPDLVLVPAGAEPEEKGVLALPVDGNWTLLLAGPEQQEQLHARETTELAAAIAAAAAAAFAQQAEHAELRRRARLQEAVARSARTLHESLDLAHLLTRICSEAAAVLDADGAVVYRVAEEELAIEAVDGLPPELIGWRMPAGAGLAGRALADERTVRTDDYAADLEPAAGSPWAEVRAAIAVPIHWDGRLHGALCGIRHDDNPFTDAHAEALEAFAELAGVAFANASAHSGLVLSAHTDGLTGCLNHVALHDGLRREVERAERAQEGTLSLILLDLERPDEGEEDGPLGDEVLRRAGHALRSTTRPYDLAARYGGDEFALVTVEADEAQACEVAARAVARLSTALDDPGGVTAGVAEWSPGMTAGDLVARADRALMYGKRAARRGEVLTEADLPPSFAPGRGRRRERRLPDAPSGPPAWTPAAGDAAEPLRLRARRLGLANRLGAALAALDREEEILAATVIDLRETFGFEHPELVPGEAPGGAAVMRDGTQWGVLRAGGDGEEDRRVLETIAEHVGAALSAARRREALERACLAAGEALVDAELPRRVVRVGRRLGLDGPALRDLALAAALGDPAGLPERGPLAAAAQIARQAIEQDDAMPLPARILAACRAPDPAVVGALLAERGHG